jgi:hypothetical protein
MVLSLVLRARTPVTIAEITADVAAVVAIVAHSIDLSPLKNRHV